MPLASFSSPSHFPHRPLGSASRKPSLGRGCCRGSVGRAALDKHQEGAGRVGRVRGGSSVLQVRGRYREDEGVAAAGGKAKPLGAVRRSGWGSVTAEALSPGGGEALSRLAGVPAVREVRRAEGDTGGETKAAEPGFWPQIGQDFIQDEGEAAGEPTADWTPGPAGGSAAARPAVQRPPRGTSRSAGQLRLNECGSRPRRPGTPRRGHALAERAPRAGRDPDLQSCAPCSGVRWAPRGELELRARRSAVLAGLPPGSPRWPREGPGPAGGGRGGGRGAPAPRTQRAAGAESPG